MNVDAKKMHQIEIQEYQNLVDGIKPKPDVLKNCIWAFLVGGAICALGQLMLNYLLSLGMSRIDASSTVSCIMIFLAAFFTGIGIYDELGKRAGAGSIVPITGFANAIVASAME